MLNYMPDRSQLEQFKPEVGPGASTIAYDCLICKFYTGQITPISAGVDHTHLLKYPPMHKVERTQQPVEQKINDRDYHKQYYHKHPGYRTRMVVKSLRLVHKYHRNG